MATPEPPAADAVALAVAAAEEEEEEGGLEVAAEGEGEGGLEVVVPIGAQKHDPAWKHCLMVRLAGRDRLKCVYCGKHFLGGGIHRFKEHLARRPGNACCCPDVPADVEAVMHRSLDEVAAKKLRKRALAAAMVAVAAASPSPAALPGASPSPSPSASASNGDLASPIHVVPLNRAPRAEETPPLGTGWSGGGAPKRRKKALTVRRAPASAPQAQQQPLQPVTPAQTQPPHQIVMALDAAAPPSLRHVHPAAGSDREQVCMAVGRFLYDAGVPLEAVNSAHFQPMVDAIASMGGRPEVLSYHDFRGCVLKKSLDEVTAQLEYYKGSWTRTGCSVLSDEWATDKGRTLMTFAGLAAGDFRRQMAIRARRTLPPAEWWYMYGGACPNLTRLAVRILSQTCSAKGCDRTRIPFEQLHDQRMNIFERQRMHHLTFVQCNLRLQNRQQYKAKAFDPISADYIDIVDDWVVDRSAHFSGPAEQPNWMEISQPFNWTPSAGPGDEFETFIEGVDDEMIQGASRGIQDNDDNEDDSNDESNTPPVGERVGSNLDKPVN